jgi:hypothetical protein
MDGEYELFERLSIAVEHLDAHDQSEPNCTAAAEESLRLTPQGVVPLSGPQDLITLRHCNDESALQYGCVDWFLYANPSPP